MLYTAKLLDGYWSLGDLPVQGPPVPPGYIWVVRDITATGFTGEDSAALYTNIGEFIVPFDTEASPGPNGQGFHWEGRAAVVAGDSIAFQGETGGWAIYVTGYVLSS
jgi:hypothetical protein